MMMFRFSKSELQRYRGWVTACRLFSSDTEIVAEARRCIAPHWRKEPAEFDRLWELFVRTLPVLGDDWLKKYSQRLRNDGKDLAIEQYIHEILKTSTEESDETGIVVAAKGVDGRGYVLDDQSCRLSPDGWANRAVYALKEHSGDRIIAETNNGGDLVERVIRTVDSRVPYKKVHASRGKLTRAEPVAALYEQGRISHVGSFPELEDELCSYTGKPGEQSPNRMDALVWAFTELFPELSLEVSLKPRNSDVYACISLIALGEHLKTGHTMDVSKPAIGTALRTEPV